MNTDRVGRARGGGQRLGRGGQMREGGRGTQGTSVIVSIKNLKIKDF